LKQQLETVQSALEAIKGEKDSLQAQIVTVRLLLLDMATINLTILIDPTTELGAGN